MCVSENEANVYWCHYRQRYCDATNMCCVVVVVIHFYTYYMDLYIFIRVYETISLYFLHSLDDIYSSVLFFLAYHRSIARMCECVCLCRYHRIIRQFNRLFKWKKAKKQCTAKMAWYREHADRKNSINKCLCECVCLSEVCEAKYSFVLSINMCTCVCVADDRTVGTSMYIPLRRYIYTSVSAVCCVL